MSVYSCHISNVSRAKGSNACATLSYISAKKIECERTGQSFSYGRQQRVLYSETLLPENAPSEFKDPSILFNAIENYEIAKDARTAKKIMVALPVEFDLELQKNVVRDFCSKLNKEGYACTFAIHSDKENKNPHAHILVANRQLGEDGFVKCKSKKQFVLDKNGERVPIIDKETGKQKLDSRNRKQWKRETVESSPLDTKNMVLSLRKSWADICNSHLDDDSRICEKSHADRGLETEPTIHEGYAAREIERRGGWSERCEINRAIVTYNRIVHAVQFYERQLEQLLMPKKKKIRYAPANTERKKFLEEQKKKTKKEKRVIEKQREKKEAEERAKQEKARQAELERQKQQHQPVYTPPPPTRSRGRSR